MTAPAARAVLVARVERIARAMPVARVDPMMRAVPVTRVGPVAPGAVAALIVWLLTACGPPDGLPPEQRGAVRCRSAIAHGAAAHAAPLRWTIHADSAGRAVLDAYCAGVGPAALHAPDTNAQDARAARVARVADTAHVALAADTTHVAGIAREDDEDDVAYPNGVVIVAWNYAMGSGDIRRFIRDLRGGVHTGGEPVRDFVLLLQEAARIGGAVPPAAALPPGVLVSSVDPVPGPDVVTLAREERLHLLFAPSMREGHGNGMRVDHGTAVLSSVPFVDPHVIELPAGIRRRVATAARLDRAAPIHVVSVHLDNFSVRQLIGSFGGVRGRQARALARTLPAADGRRALVVGGDLNTWAGGTREPAFRALRERLPRPDPLQPQATARRLGVPRRLDYLLLDAPAGWSFEERRIENRYGSDHHPLIGLLRPPAGQQHR